MRRTECGGCSNPDLEVFLDLGESPLANKLPSTPDEVEVFYPLELAVCARCMLVQMMEVVPAEIVFGAGDYSFYSSTSPGLVRYHRSYAEYITRQFPDQVSGLIVEIACNDGDLLQHFRAAGKKTLGVDPASGPAAAAVERGLNVIEDAFGEQLAQDISRDYGQATLVIANHVTAHVIDLVDFLGGVQTLLAPDGVAILEVQYLPDLLVGNQFDHVYHEHRYFFSLLALEHVLSRVGLSPIDVRIIEPQGGSMRLVVMHDSAASVVGEYARLNRVRQAERKLQGLDVYTAMQMRANRVRDRLHDLLGDQHLQGNVIAGYGLPAKATTLLNFCQVGPDLVSHIVDTTPAKIGKYAPGTKIPVVGPGEFAEPDTYLVLVWNYLRGILQRETKFRERGGQLIVPIPVPVIL